MNDENSLFIRVYLVFPFKILCPFPTLAALLCSYLQELFAKVFAE